MTKLTSYFMLGLVFLFVACEPTEPEPENDEETITEITLSFSDSAGNILVTKAVDPDGDGPENLVFDDPLTLKTSTDYTLTIELFNGIANEDITAEVQQEGDEHQLFFGWSEGLFTQPEGTGNITDAAGNVNYLDGDVNSLPLGIVTQWVTGTMTGSEMDFQVILKHQPDIKSETSTAQDGETDLDLTFQLMLED